jgi:hypothetical protein
MIVGNRQGPPWPRRASMPGLSFWLIADGKQPGAQVPGRTEHPGRCAVVAILHG